MRLARKPALLIILALALITIFLAYNHANDRYKRSNMTALNPRLQSLFDNTKTVCFGRFVVEVPSTAIVIYGPTAAPDDIVRYPGEGERINEHVAQKVAEVMDPFQRELADDIGKASLYGTVTDGAVAAQKLVFGNYQGMWYSIDSFQKVGSDLYVQSAVASPKDGPEERSNNRTVDQNIATLNSIAQHLRVRNDGEVPSEPGLCIDGAFITDNPAVSHERVALGVRLKEFPDVHFSIEVNKNQGSVVESNALNTRIQQNRDRANAQGLGLWYAGIRELRSAERDLAQWKGYEHLAHLPGREDMRERHDFAFMALGAPSDPLEPMLDVQMTTGVVDNVSGKVPPSLSDEEAVAVWDRLIGSIRTRSAEGSTKVGELPTPDYAPLGELVATGRPCPQDGWWECAEEGRPIQGGKRQFFRAGVLMPPAVLQGEASVWQKLKRDTPTYQTSTVWKLVEYGATEEASNIAGRQQMPVAHRFDKTDEPLPKISNFPGSPGGESQI